MKKRWDEFVTQLGLVDIDWDIDIHIKCIC